MLPPRTGKLPETTTSSKARRRRNPEERLQAILRLLRLAKKLGSVSEACRIMKYSRSSLYRFRSRLKSAGIAGLALPDPHRPHPGNRLPDETIATILDLADRHPQCGAPSVVKYLYRRGLAISFSGVRRVWLGHHLESVAKRMQARHNRERAARRTA